MSTATHSRVDPCLLQVFADRFNNVSTNGHKADDFPEPLATLWRSLDALPQGASPLDITTVLQGWYGGDSTRLDLMDEIWKLKQGVPLPPLYRFKVHTFIETLQPAPPIAYVVDNLISRDSVGVFFGEPGSFKTYLLLDMAVCVAMGKDWAGIATNSGSVLIIDEESGNARLHRRLREIRLGETALPDSPITYVTLEHIDLRDDTDVAEVGALMADTQPALVIVDALADVMLGGEENSVKDVQPLFLNLRKLAQDHNAAIIVIHHANKGGTYRGSSAIKGAVDLLIEVKADSADMSKTAGQETYQINLTTEKSRDAAPRSLAARLTFDKIAGSVWVEASSPTPRAAHFSKAEDYVIRYLTDNGPSMMADIEANADTCSSRSARNAVYALASRKIVQRSNGGGQGSAAMYELASSYSTSPSPGCP